MTFITQQTYLGSFLYTQTHQNSADTAQFFLKPYKAVLWTGAATFSSH